MTGANEFDLPGTTRGVRRRLRFETTAWLAAIAKYVPGHFGVWLRNALLPYERGSNVVVWDAVHIDHPSRLRMGSNVSINRLSTLNATGGITIGDDVLIGPYVLLQSQNHRFDDAALNVNLQGYTREPIVIGDNVWIGAKAVVLPGVHIGDHSIIAAGSVVTRSVPSGVLMAGVPAREIRALR